jgi:hypothetical protein
MKQFLLVLGLAALSAAAQTVVPFYELSRDGEVVKEYTSLAYCEAGAKGLGTKAGGTTVYDCVRRVRVVAPVVAAPTPTPTPVPTPTPTAGAWVQGQLAAAVPATARPARGVAAIDPVTMQAVYRVTDSADPVSGFGRNDYSRRQAFNANNTRQLVSSLDGHWHTYNANTFAYEKKLAALAGDAEPQWHPSDPDLLYFLPFAGVGMTLRELDVSTNTARTVAEFGPRLKAIWPTAAAAWTRSEGSPSADGRYWCFMVDNPSWASLGVFVWDMSTNTITGTLPTGGDRPDHVSMSPSGKSCVVSWTSSKGTVAFSRDFKTSRKVHTVSEHSDLVLMPDGSDTYVTVDYGTNSGDVFMVNLDTGVRTALFASYPGDGSSRAFHFSGKGYGCPGWVLVSAQHETAGKALSWMDRKLTLVEMKAGGRVLNVAHHRAGFPASDGYFFSPVASISRDCTRVAFTSTWGTGVQADISAYQVRLPAIK